MRRSTWRARTDAAARENRLTADERARNSFGDSWTFVYDETADVEIASSLPGFFPDLHHCKSVMTPFELPTLTGLKLVKGLCEGVLLGKDAVAGFPSLSTLPCTGALGFQAVSVFQQESRNESMVLTVDNPHEGVKTGDLAASLIGTTAYYGWPFLQEGRVVAVSDGLFRYEPQASARGAIVSTPHTPQGAATWHKTAERIENHYSKRCGVIIGTVDTLVHLRLVKGLKQLDDGALVKDYDDRDVDCAVQALVTHVSSQDERYLERDARPIMEDFPADSKVFLLGSTAYGAPAIVIGHHDDHTLAVKAMVRRCSSSAADLAARRQRQGRRLRAQVARSDPLATVLRPLARRHPSRPHVRPHPCQALVEPHDGHRSRPALQRRSQHQVRLQVAEGPRLHAQDGSGLGVFRQGDRAHRELQGASRIIDRL